MSVVAGGCAAAVAAGAVLVVTGVTDGRPDPVARAMGDRLGPPGALDAWLDRWSAWLGRERQDRCLDVIGRSRRQHRRTQLQAAAAALALVVAVTLTQGLSAALLIWAVLAVPGALLLAEQQLRRRAAAVRIVIGGQVLQASEHIALVATAGLTVAEALDRAARAAPEPLAGRLAAAHAEIRAGRSIQAALGALAARLEVAELTRLADTMTTAAQRGAPLADVLIEQVADTRAARRAAQLERAGRAELSMLLPIVFCVLPCVVAVALLPGAQLLGSI